MDDKATQDYKESDSQSPSDNEKHIGHSPIDRVNQEIPDPDAHLSEEERKKIVWYQSNRPSNKPNTSIGSQAALET